MTVVSAGDAPVLIGRCTGCGQTFRADLAADARVFAGAHWGIATNWARTAGFPAQHDCRAGVRCTEGENGLPACGDWDCDGHDRTQIQYRVLRSTWKPEVACKPGNCHQARNATCTCSCRGRNHGSAWRIATATT
jgi:hypothetical protein